MSGSRRRRPLPPEWATVIRPRVLRRDGHRCLWMFQAERILAQPGHGITIHEVMMLAGACTVRGSEVDHIDPDGPDEDANLRSLCRGHHQVKSSGEGGRAAGIVRRARAAGKKRPPEAHPGLRPAGEWHAYGPQNSPGPEAEGREGRQQ